MIFVTEGFVECLHSVRVNTVWFKLWYRVEIRLANQSLVKSFKKFLHYNIYLESIVEEKISPKLIVQISLTEIRTC